MKKETRVIGSLAMSGLMLAGGAAAVGVPMAEAATADQAFVAQTIDAEQSGANEVREVKGEFSFDQNRISETDSIRGMFMAAVNALCSPTVDNAAVAEAKPISVYVGQIETMHALVSEMSAESEMSPYSMGCACASNVAGGGAIVNADVQGVPLEEVMNQAMAAAAAA